ncbi:MAG: transglutaminase domain-containing protein [Candidatus Bathyarchaeota archaeon]|nr:transglutaminase domain-containing protein [Candidatus Bathyarchaeota archaeon]
MGAPSGSSQNSRLILVALTFGVVLAAFLLSSTMTSIPYIWVGVDTNNPLNPTPGNCSPLPNNGTSEPNSSPNGAIPSSTPIEKKDCFINSQGGDCGKEPVLEIYGKTETTYIRSAVAAQYNGGMWSLGPDFTVVPYKGDLIPQEMNLFSKRTESSIIIHVVNPCSGFVPTLYYTNRLEFTQNVQATYYPQQHLFYTSDKFSQPYYEEFTNYQFSLNTLQNAHVTSGSQSSQYLQVPENLRQSLQEILNAINIPPEASDYQKITAIQQYLFTNYTYDLNYSRAPPGKEPVLWFLFEAKRGVCANFNSAFTLLLRTEGIPSRMVSGFLINGGLDYQLVRANQGHAWAEVLFNEIGWIEFDATGSDGSTPEPLPIPSVSTETKITNLSSLATKGQNFTVQGTVTDANGNPVSGLKVTVTLKENKNDEGGIICGYTEVTNGFFKVQGAILYSTPVGDYNVIATTIGNDLYYGSESDPIMRVKAQTQLNTTSTINVTQSQPFAIVAQLTENTTETPIQNAQIQLTYNIQGKTKTVTATTNQTGYATLQCTPISELAGDVAFSLQFSETNYYLPTQADGQIEVKQVLPDVMPSSSPTDLPPDDNKEKESPLLLILIVAASSASVTVVGAAFYLRGRKNHLAPKTEPVASEEKPQIKPVTPTSPSGVMLEINFPQINKPFPNVWGVNEPLKIEFELKKHNEPLKGAVSIQFDNQKTQTLNIGETGVATLEIQYSNKGTHTITAEFFEKSKKPLCTAVKILRVVNYTEEVVNMFKEDFHFQKDKGTPIDQETTPREFQNAVLKYSRLADKKSLENFVSLFEIANYSLSTLNRPEYEEMYLSDISIRGASNKNPDSGV